MKGNSHNAFIALGVATGLLLSAAPLAAQAQPAPAPTLDSVTLQSEQTDKSAQAQSQGSGASADASSASDTASGSSAGASHASVDSAATATGTDTDSSDVSGQSDASGSLASESDQNDSATRNENGQDTSADTSSNKHEGWVTENGVRHWYLADGTMAHDQIFYSTADRAWFWANADGSIATNQDVAILRNRKNLSAGTVTAHFDALGHLVGGERYDHGNWFLIDTKTGEAARGVRHLSSNRGKWVYYDITTGEMAHGERHLSYDRAHNGWYYFDRFTGKMAHGMTYLRATRGKGGKWVYYDKVTGIMAHGARMIGGRPYYFDPVTGRRWSGAEERALLVRTARSLYGKHPAVRAALVKAGGKNNPYGPCAAYVWYVFRKAGLSPFLAGGTASGWPLDNWWWYRSRGRLSMTPHVGDIAFYWWPGPQPGVSHEGLVTRVDKSGVWITDAAFDNIGERHTYTSALRGYGHPYWN